MSYFSDKARERRVSLRAQGRCIWCGDLLVYPDDAEGRTPTHTLAPRMIRGQLKKSERCDECRKKEKERRASSRNDVSEPSHEQSANHADGSSGSVLLRDGAPDPGSEA